MVLEHSDGVRAVELKINIWEENCPVMVALCIPPLGQKVLLQ